MSEIQVREKCPVCEGTKVRKIPEEQALEEMKAYNKANRQWSYTPGENMKTLDQILQCNSCSKDGYVYKWMPIKFLGLRMSVCIDLEED